MSDPTAFFFSVDRISELFYSSYTVLVNGSPVKRVFSGLSGKNGYARAFLKDSNGNLILDARHDAVASKTIHGNVVLVPGTANTKRKL